MQQDKVKDSFLDSLKKKKPLALDTFYNQYAPALYGDVRRMLNKHKAADEILVHAFTSIWTKIDEYNPEKERLFTWALKLVRKEACETKINLAIKELFACQPSERGERINLPGTL